MEEDAEVVEAQVSVVAHSGRRPDYGAPLKEDENSWPRLRPRSEAFDYVTTNLMQNGAGCFASQSDRVIVAQARDASNPRRSRSTAHLPTLAGIDDLPFACWRHLRESAKQSKTPFVTMCFLKTVTGAWTTSRRLREVREL